jgi:hypothetical protein
VTYTQDYEANEMIRQLEMTRMNVTHRRIERNSDLDNYDEDASQSSNDKETTNKSKSNDNGNKTSENGNRRKKQESKAYTKIYIYQCVHYKKCRKRARCSTSKRKTRNGKFL